MKTIFRITFTLALIAIFAACHDDDFSSKHVYTDAEIVMMDSIAAAKQNVNADLVVVYDISTEQNDDYASVVIGDDEEDKPMEIIMTAFGISSADALIQAFEDETLTLFAVSGTTNSDDLSSYTANGLGYWYTAGGDITTWGTNSAVFNEFYPEENEFVFYIGQFPEACKVGDEIRLVEIVTNGEYRIGFIFNISII